MEKDHAQESVIHSVQEQIPTHVVLVNAVIVDGENRVLLAQRSLDDNQAPGAWAVPGGKVDPIDQIQDKSKPIKETLAKEVAEEVGVEITDKLVYLASQIFTRSSGHSVVGIYFKCEYKSGEARPLEDQERIKWLSLTEIMELLESGEIPAYLKHIFLRLEEEM